MKLDIYIRVSQVAGRGGESFQSPSDQEAVTRRAVEGMGAEVGEVNTVDLDKSGGTADRPGFQRVLRRIDAGEVDGIAVVRADRFARNVRVAWECLGRIKDAGGKFVSATEHVDLLSASGKLQFNTLMSMAQYQRDLAEETWARAQANAVERGVTIAATPVGYERRVVNPTTGKLTGKLHPHPDHSPKVRRAFELWTEGETKASIMRWLDDQGVPTQRGKRWTVQAVTRLLQNEVYLGVARHGERRLEGAHEAIVSPALFRAAQARRTSVPVSRSEDWLLAGFLRCAGCRHTLKGKRGNYRDGVGQNRYYACADRSGSGSCPDPIHSLPADEIEALIVAEVLDGQKWKAEALGATLDSLTAAREHEDESARQVKEAYAQRRKARFPELADEDVAEAETVLEAATQDRLRLERLATPDGTPLLFDLASMWPEMTHDERRVAIEGELEFAVVRHSDVPLAERVEIVRVGQTPDDLPSRGRSVPLKSWTWGTGDEVKVGVAALQNRA